jgi:response regulator RpfG family c-di-GMP phosphodiesterase
VDSGHKKQRGTQFAPDVIDALFAGISEILDIYLEYADTTDPGARPER